MKDIRENEKILRKAADVLNTEPEQVPAVLKKFQKDIIEDRVRMGSVDG